MTFKAHFKKAAEHHRALAEAHSALAGSERLLGKSAEGRMDLAAAKLHKDRADVFQAMGEAHNAHAAQLSEMANSGPETWGLAGWTVDGDGQPTNEKMVKSFFDSLYEDGLFSPAPKMQKAAANPGDLL
jgi:hypothetical protein